MYTVKQVAKKLDVSTETIRYYTRLGIINPSRDSGNGYRYYSDKDIHLIKFVRKAKEYGLTIHEISEILDRSQKGESPCPIVKSMVKNRLQETRYKIRELLELEKRLSHAVLEWELKHDHIPTEEMICPLIEKGLSTTPYEVDTACHEELEDSE